MLKSWWLNGFIWPVTGRLEENDKKCRWKELKLTVKPNWNDLHFLQLHDILLFIYFCTVHILLYCSHIFTQKYFTHTHKHWTAFDWLHIFVILYSYTEYELHLIDSLFLYCSYIFVLLTYFYNEVFCTHTHWTAFDWLHICILLYFYTK